MRPYQISVCGDSAINIVVADAISAEASALVRSAAARIQAAGIAGIEDIVPTFCAVMVAYNPEIISYEELISAVHANLDGLSAEGASAGKTIVIPVCYGGEFGEDIAFVASHAGLTEQEVIDIHTGRDYLIFMLGFLPGFAYLGDMDKRLHTPRLSNPRTSIPAGSVGIGGEQTGIYPLASPGGWQLIGRTPVKPYDPTRAEPILYRAGDYIRFFAVDEQEYRRIEELVSRNEYECRITTGEGK